MWPHFSLSELTECETIRKTRRSLVLSSISFFLFFSVITFIIFIFIIVFVHISSVHININKNQISLWNLCQISDFVKIKKIFIISIFFIFFFCCFQTMGRWWRRCRSLKTTGRWRRSSWRSWPSSRWDISPLIGQHCSDYEVAGSNLLQGGFYGGRMDFTA